MEAEMIHETIRFTEKYDDAYLESYLHSHNESLKINKRPTIIVCPGGGYVALSEREAEPIALQYFAHGLNAFILRYSIKEKAADFAPVVEACLAIKYLRENSDALCVDEKNIFITGFSAGGHLAASAGTMWNSPEVADRLGISDPTVCRPDGCILCYPVITNSKYRHKGSILTLNGGVCNEEEMDRFSLEKRVDADTPPAFIWHTASDTAVPVENSLLFAAALSEHKIPFELHVYPDGPHGLALCNKETWVGNPRYVDPHSEGWMDLSIKWIDKIIADKK